MSAAAWEEIATGVRPPAEAEAGLVHAATCARCGPLLRRAAELLADDERESALPDLPSSHPAGRRQLAQRLQALQGLMSHRPRGRSRRAWAWTIAAALLLAGLFSLPRWGRAYVAEYLVQRAYSQHRILPLRLAGAAYAPVLPPRRGALPPLPPALLEAEGLAGSGLAAHPDDTTLLRIQGQAYLVEGNAAAAVIDLGRALAHDAHDAHAPALLIDLASAYYESAADGNAADYSHALDALGQALALRPRDALASFNRALVEEALQDFPGAIADWTAYLQRDARGAWAAEARRHLEQDRALVGQHDAAVAAPLLRPAALAGRADFAVVVEPRIEDYLDAAVADWLPAAFPVAGAPDAASRAALAGLAGQLQSVHHDTWLGQMLRQAPPPGTPAAARYRRAVAELAAAVAATKTDRIDAARAAAEQAQADFGDNAPAGRARAAFEQAYDLQLRELDDACLAVLHRRLPPAAVASFGWLEGAAVLEGAECGGDAAGAPRAEALARADGYPAMEMRAALLAASADPAADSPQFWKSNRAQLASYWSGRVGPYSAFSRYLVMAANAGQLQDWYAAERLAAAAVERVALTPEPAYQASARQFLAAYAEQCGFTAEAEDQRTRAEALFAGLPQTPATANWRAYNQLELALIAMRRQQPARARQALASYRREQPPVVSLEGRALPYFTILGELQWDQGHAAAAAQDERAAIAISESGMRQRPGTNDEDRLDWQARNRDAYRAWMQLQWSRQDPVAALEFWEWARGASVRPARPLPASFLAAARSFDAAGAPPLPEPDLVRRALPRLLHTQAVSYAIFPQVLDVWLYDNRGIHAVQVPVAGARLEAAAHAFALACADPASDAALLRAQGQQLYGWLLAPVAAWLDPSRTLIVEPDGDLAEVPFAALTTPSGGYLAQPVLTSPGLEFARLARPVLGPSRQQSMVAVGDPHLGGATGTLYPPLPETRAEAAAAAARFSPQSQVLVGEAATRAAVLAALPAADAFLFAGHCAGGQLLLADGGTLAAADFTAARLPRCRLVSLAACATAGGESASLMDAQGLVRALLRAGVPRVLATRWAVDSATAAELDRAFYTALAAGAPAARALVQAQRQLRRQPATAAPFYWAGFAAFGAEAP